MAHFLTGLRLLLVVPVGLAFGRPQSSWAHWEIPILVLAIATDLTDGRVARLLGAQSSFGQLFDHTTDCLFVTAGLIGTAVSGATTLLLPVLVALAFAQYVLDSRFLHRTPALRMSGLGRRNGIFYFVPICFVAGARSGLLGRLAPPILMAAWVLSYLLVASTLISMTDRAVASLHPRR